MTALDNSGEYSMQGRGTSQLSLRQNRKRSLASDISPAPEPRTSHRLCTLTNTEAEERNKTPPTVRKMSLSRTLTTSSGRRTSTAASQSSATTSGVSGATGELGYTGGHVSGVCPLANMGNTCFLNSVLYALRFLPGFTHDLHHLHMHLQSAGEQKDVNLEQRIQFLSELHQVFVRLGQQERAASEKRIPAFEPYDFLEALRVVNPMFEGNRQQDAHELLHCLLDQLCHLPQDLLQVKPNGTAPAGWGESCGASRDHEASPPEPKRSRRRSERIQAIEEDSSKAVDVVGSKFVGRMCLETCCLECEQVTGREENFLEVCVPVKTKDDFEEDQNVDEPHVFMSALNEEECLQDNNKYWCDHCFHHNEARRSVHFSQLPHHLVIHVKRFSAYHRNMNTFKCTEAMPAPLILPCFCRGCYLEKLKHKRENLAWEDRTGGTKRHAPSHLPYYLTAVVCHLGATLSSGHYLSFVRVSALQSSKCPEQQQQQQQQQQPQPQPQQPSPPSQQASHSPTAPSTKVDCQWMRCCGLQLDHIRPLSVLNGHYDEENSREQDNLWLECDDDKIKLVTSQEVCHMMRTTNITPYLLFYSHL